MKKKVVPKLRQEVKVKVDIVTSNDEVYYTGKFQDFTARYIMKCLMRHWCVCRVLACPEIG